MVNLEINNFDVFSEHIGDIIETLNVAGDVIMRVYESEEFETSIKDDLSPVTTADLLSNKIMTYCLQILFPDIPIISEETPLEDYSIREKWDQVWLLDPLDGTKEFLHRTDEFSVNLALVQGGKPVIGFIHLPVQKETFYAVKGGGAYLWKDNTRTKLTANTFSLSQKGIKVVMSQRHTDDLTMSYISKLEEPIIVKLGSALKFTSIAQGNADYYPRMIHIMEWDTAAGQIIIEESGGTLVDANTMQAMIYNKPSMVNPHFIAAGKMK